MHQSWRQCWPVLAILLPLQKVPHGAVLFLHLISQTCFLMPILFTGTIGYLFRTIPTALSSKTIMEPMLPPLTRARRTTPLYFMYFLPEIRVLLLRLPVHTPASRDLPTSPVVSKWQRI